MLLPRNIHDEREEQLALLGPGKVDEYIEVLQAHLGALEELREHTTVDTYFEHQCLITNQRLEEAKKFKANPYLYYYLGTFSEVGIPNIDYSKLNDDEIEQLDKLMVSTAGREGAVPAMLLDRSKALMSLYKKGILVKRQCAGIEMDTLGIFGVYYPQNIDELRVYRSRFGTGEPTTIYPFASDLMLSVKKVIEKLNNDYSAYINYSDFKQVSVGTMPVIFETSYRIESKRNITKFGNIPLPENTDTVTCIIAFWADNTTTYVECKKANEIISFVKL